MLPECRLLIEAEPQAGCWNMAVDEALLEAVIAGGPAVLRWYQWREPTLSLGYFQAAAEVEAEPRWQHVAKVRRLTGGGAILHDHEWTYSCVLPADQKLVRHPYDLYDIIHNAIVDWFRESQGIPLSQRGVSSRSTAEPALCFLRQDSHDVVHGETKVLGSAQRRRKGVLLQHGSLVLQRSNAAPELPGLWDLVNVGSAMRTDSDASKNSVRTADPARDLAARQQLAQFIASRLSTKVIPDELTSAEQQRARELAASNYAGIDQR